MRTPWQTCASRAGVESCDIQLLLHGAYIHIAAASNAASSSTSMMASKVVRVFSGQRAGREEDTATLLEKVEVGEQYERSTEPRWITYSWNARWYVVVLVVTNLTVFFGTLDYARDRFSPDFGKQGRYNHGHFVVRWHQDSFLTRCSGCSV